MRPDTNVIPTLAFQRYELMVELGRLEMVLDNVRSTSQPAANDTVVAIESRCARIQEALSRLPA